MTTLISIKNKFDTAQSPLPAAVVYRRTASVFSLSPRTAVVKGTQEPAKNGAALDGV